MNINNALFDPKEKKDYFAFNKPRLQSEKKHYCSNNISVRINDETRLFKHFQICEKEK